MKIRLVTHSNGMEWHGMAWKWNAATAFYMCGREEKCAWNSTLKLLLCFPVLQDIRLDDFPADGLLIYFYCSFTSRMRFDACGFRVGVYPFFPLAKRSTITYLIRKQISRVFSIVNPLHLR